MFPEDPLLNISELSHEDDNELMKRLVANELAAWSELVNRYAKLVYSISFQIIKNNSDAEDAVQNTFMRIKLYANKFDTSQSLKPWLSRIASSEAIRIYKRKKNTKKKESIKMNLHNNSTRSPRWNVAEIVEQTEVKLTVKKAIAILPETSRVAITLYYAGGMNQSEIASELGLSQVFISKEIKSGLEKIRAYLKKAGIQSAIVLSPNLVQAGIISISPSDDLISKLVNNFLSEIQNSQLANTKINQSTSFFANKYYLAWLCVLLIISAVTFLGYFYWENKSKYKNLADIKKNEPVMIAKERIFTKADFSGYQPVYFQKYQVQKDLNKKETLENTNLQRLGGERKWSIINNHVGGNTITRGVSSVETFDGLYLKQTFRQPHLFKGKITVYPGEKKFGFLLKLPNLTTDEIIKVVSLSSEGFQQINISNQFSEILNITSNEGGELDFKIYVWLNKNQWRTASFYQVKGNPKKYFASCYLLDNNEGFNFGLYSNCQLEGANFEYSPLGVFWDIRNEPDIKAILNELPKDYLPEIKE